MLEGFQYLSDYQTESLHRLVMFNGNSFLIKKIVFLSRTLQILPSALRTFGPLNLWGFWKGDSCMPGFINDFYLKVFIKN